MSKEGGYRQERRDGLRVAFQGERGAFSEEAAVQFFSGQIELVPRPSFEALFSAIDDGVADVILAPIENSLAGTVQRSCDLLLARKLTIQGEVVIPIMMCLIGAPGARWEDIHSVESHPVALAQCENFLSEHPHIRRIVAEDTAGSVRNIVQGKDVSRAAIAGIYAAGFYGGVVLREHVEDHRENYTRFLLLSRSMEIPRGANKLSLVLHLAHRPGSLHAALGPFAKRRIDLLRIESRPIQGRPWEYRFYLELAASTQDPEARAALEELRARGNEIAVLGCYVSAQIAV
jgi:prephenate dehydratase